MEPTIVVALLIAITVSASTHPLESYDTTTSSPEDPSRIFFTIPQSFDNAPQYPPNKSSGENRLEITLKMDESDKEVVDNDMGKYLESKNDVSTASVCASAKFKSSVE